MTISSIGEEGIITELMSAITLEGRREAIEFRFHYKVMHFGIQIYMMQIIIIHERN